MGESGLSPNTFEEITASRAPPTAGVFTPGQSTSLLIFVAGLVLWFLRRTRSDSARPQVA